jgi:hypothetical protein
MRHDPASAAIVITLRSLKMSGMAQAVADLMEQGSPAFEAAVPILSQLLKAETAERDVRSVANRIAALAVVQVGGGHLGLADQVALLVHGDMGLVAEIGLVVLDREAGVRIARIDLSLLVRRAFHRRHDDRRVDQGSLLDDQAPRVELPIDLGQKLFRQAKLVHCLPETPNRRMVRRLGVERDAAKAPERQPVAYGFLGLRVRQIVPLL